MSILSAQSTVADLVRERPGRTRVFEQLRIDYCCGGKVSLAEACAKKNLDLDDVLARLQTADAESARYVDADAMTLTELADHIEETHHKKLKAKLPRLGTMLQKVAAVHGDRYPWMVETQQIYAGFADELQSHMMKEEEVLFPRIRELDRRSANGPTANVNSIANSILTMEHEHDDAGRALEQFRQLTGDYTPPADACNTFRAALDGLQELERDMHQHVHKENNVLFPKALKSCECK